MDILFWIIGVLAALTALVLAVAYVCFYKVFYSRTSAKSRTESEEIYTPSGKEYDPYRERIIELTRQMRARPHKDVTIRSFDGLELRARYYEYKKGAPIEILFHGYKSNSERDLCGGIDRCFLIGHNVFVVDHRASGRSEGKVISFGVNESRDCKAWVDYVTENIDPDAKIIIGGISMGAATVMSCAHLNLPKNVVGIVADCGYTSTEDIVKKVMKDMHLPPAPLFPFVKLGARIFGKFKVDEISPIESLKKSRLPVIFFHGDADDFVPHSMSEENFAACTTKKRLVTIKGAAHGLCFLVDPDTYLAELEDFFGPELYVK